MTTDAQERKERLERILEKIVVFYDKDQNEHELKFFFKIPVLQAYEITKEKGGKMPLKKTKKHRENVTPALNNKATVE